jgi:hypothetical protein
MGGCGGCGEREKGVRVAEGIGHGQTIESTGSSVTLVVTEVSITSAFSSSGFGLGQFSDRGFD